MTMTSLLKALRRALPRGRSVAAVAFAALLLTGAAGAGVFGPTAEQYADEHGPVGEAEAFACGGVCLAGAGIATGALVGYATNEYLSGNPTSETYTSADRLETQTDVYAHTKTIEQDSELFTTTVNNQAGDGMRTVAWSKGKLAVIESMNSNESQSMAIADGKNATREYYSVTERNIVKSWNAQIGTLDYLNGVWLNHGELNSTPYTHNGGRTYAGTTTANYTLVNGTQIEVVIPKFAGTQSTNAYGPFAAANVSGSSVTYYNIVADSAPPVTMNNPDGSDNASPILSGVDYTNALTAVSDGNSQMEANIEMYTNNTYSQYTAGDINTSDLMDPTTLAQEMSTQYNSTGYYAYAGADLAVLGAGADLNKSMSIETSSGTTLNGTLFTDWSPSSTNGSFETGTWYTPPDAEMVYVATNDGLTLVSEDFRINEMTDTKTGESVNSTTLQEYNRQTSDVTLTQEQLDALLNLRQMYDDMEQDAATGGSGGGLGDDLNSTHVLALLALAAAAAVLSRN